MDTVRIVDVLRQAQNLIRDEQNWQQGNYSISGMAPYCAIGALANVIGNTYDGKLFNKVERLLASTARLMGYHNAEWLNDNMGHASVMTLYNLTIQLLEDGFYERTQS